MRICATFLFALGCLVLATHAFAEDKGCTTEKPHQPAESLQLGKWWERGAFASGLHEPFEKKSWAGQWMDYGTKDEFFRSIGTVPSDELARELKNLRDCRVDERCVAGDRIRALLWRDSARADLPDALISIEKDERNGSNTWSYDEPVLLWNHLDTPHLLGVRHLYALLFLKSDKTPQANEPPPPMKMNLTVEHRTVSVQLLKLLGALKDVTGVDKDALSGRADQTDPDNQSVSVIWRPLNDRYWLGFAAVKTYEDSVHRVTITFDTEKLEAQKAALKKAVSDGAQAAFDEATKAAKAAEAAEAAEAAKAGKKKPSAEPPVVIDPKTLVRDRLTEMDAIDKEADAAIDHRFDPQFFVSAEGNCRPTSSQNVALTFSNTITDKVGVSLAEGTFPKARGTAVSARLGDSSLNTYALLEYYLVPPLVSANSAHFFATTPSLGIVLGTGLLDAKYKEVVLGVSLGHLIGPFGFVAAWDHVPTPDGHRERLLIGLKYSLW